MLKNSEIFVVRIRLYTSDVVKSENLRFGNVFGVCCRGCTYKRKPQMYSELLDIFLSFVGFRSQVILEKNHKICSVVSNSLGQLCYSNGTKIWVRDSLRAQSKILRTVTQGLNTTSIINF